MITKKEHETLTEFQMKVDQAKLAGEEWVETTPEILKYFNRKGMGRAEYFDYQGIKVTEFGKTERLQQELARQVGALVHGAEEARVNQITKTVPIATAGGLR